MLWRKKLRSPSPPRLTSSIPEMEHHLATMDSPIPDTLVENIDASATTSEELRAASKTAQDRSEKHAADPTREALNNQIEENDSEPSVTPSKDAESSMTKKIGSIRTKAQRSQPQFLTLVACVSYLLFQLLGVDLGLRLVNGYTGPRLHRAEVQLQAAVSDLVSEQILHNRLDNLLSTTLDRCYMESYEHCLARGLYKADNMFLGVDFTQFSDVRNQTMDWATDNCDRLLYTPQLYAPNTSRLWTTANNIRRAAEKALRLFQYKATLLRCKLHGMNPRLAAKPIVVEANNNIAKRSEVPAEMPFGFGLDCEGRAHCRLIYSGLSASATDRKTIDEAVVKASKEVFKWSYPFERIFRVNGYMISLLSLLQPLLGNFFLLAVLLSRPRPQSKAKLPLSARLARAWMRICNNIAYLQHDEKLALGLIINTALYALLHYQLEYIISEFDQILLPVGLGFCVFHAIQALAFLDPEVATKETLRSFCRATKELYLMIQDIESFPEPTSKTQVPSAHSEAIIASVAKPASKIGARFISPLTPISEDLQQERKVMHAEQGNQPGDDVEPRYRYATETDSEYESDVQHATYVDLVGGATPTVSEDGEEWTVVED
ncbi:hypothetical protein BU25DRAFT_463404 [Macroventuria anomochaeta]|uniref:Uncharacterized protein n=1 Tax=Macroventuria anomochaeta TaxID=301207 RepID=A0ACB6RIN4_9PLEO|nr:uncharacterized protein BU25DRAFT_463404 [Macroventuria anomochaeta]KAF2621800.1 hypothetical protein BU25DRAFT_463404 [Macroventuria anomochaeta]